jgi:hypothetical protein
MMLVELEKRTTGIFYLTPDIEKGWMDSSRPLNGSNLSVSLASAQGLA